MSTKALCPICRSPVDAESIGGLCAACFARGALDLEHGWLDSTQALPAETLPVVSGWRILGVLGAGGMGQVYRAESETDGTPGAVKVLEARWSRDPLMAARIEAEAAALAKLEHEHIVRVLEVTEAEDGRFCLVIELVDGCDLARLMRGERLTLARAMDIFQKVCAAVEFAHGKGFAHRDIKPANILVGQDGTVKLGDFGLVKRVAETADGVPSSIGALTLTTDRFGSAYYLAPEVLTHGSSDGMRADIYALGVLLYHLLTGQMPLGKYVPASQLTGMSRALDHAIASALEANPDQRITSVRDLSHKVADAWNAHLHREDRARSRPRWLVLAAVAGFTILAALTGAWWQQARQVPPTALSFTPAATASKEAPWENSLGMKFVPVPGTRVLFSIWETRRRDVEPFFAMSLHTIANTWLEQARKDAATNIFTLNHGRLVEQGSWHEPGFTVTPDHPAMLCTLTDTRHFCLWLTWKERSEGRLRGNEFYRLPTRAEWLIACGGPEAALMAGNVAGPEARDEHWPLAWPTFTDGDPFPRTSPVGSFPAERFGLCDMSGNVCEWTLDSDDDESTGHLMGPAFHDGSPERARWEPMRQLPGKKRLQHVGFRIVLDLRPE